MKAITKVLAGGAAIAALAGAAPAMAQVYPGYGNPGYGTPGYGYPGYGAPGYGYGGVNSQTATSQCTQVVQARLTGGYGGQGYGGYGGGYGGYQGYGGNGGYGGYGYNGYASPYGYGGARVLGISRVEPRPDGVTVHGVATTGRYGAAQVDLTWRCRTDFRGFVVDVNIAPAQRNYGYGNAPQAYTPYNPYSQYGYVRY